MDLGQYYAIRDGIIAGLDRQGSVFEESLNVIAWMIDRALFTILSAIPDPDHPGVYRPSVSPFQRHDAWRKAIHKQLASEAPRWPAPKQIGPHQERSE